MIVAELNQECLKGGQRLPRAVLDRALAVVSKELKIRKKREVSIAFVSKRTMKQLNKTYRGKDSVTDVLSFGIDDPVSLGELILSYDQAHLQAKQQSHSVRHEIVFLIVHGLLHLHSYDHEQEGDARKMFAVQDRLLRTLDVNPSL